MEQLSAFLVGNFEPLFLAAIAVLVAVAGIKFQERVRLQHYFGELRVWASDAVNDLSEAVHLCQLEPQRTHDPDFFNRRHSLLIRMSAKVDQGRWFFPNSPELNTETTLNSGKLGPRQRPLDNLVFAYNLVKDLSYEDREANLLLRASLVEIKKDFTRSIQTLLDPRKSQKGFAIAMESTNSK